MCVCVCVCLGGGGVGLWCRASGPGHEAPDDAVRDRVGERHQRCVWFSGISFGFHFRVSASGISLGYRQRHQRCTQSVSGIRFWVLDFGFQVAQ